ncbi:MAG TPA: VWA domain-containing protein [Bryobacteraceae bacterium]
MRPPTLCLAVCSIVFQAAAQAPAQPEPEVVSHDSPVTFSSRVNLVQVPVVVRDREGRAIGGLKREDFQLLDKGKLQVITKFTIQNNPTTAGVIPSSNSAKETAGNSAPASKPELPERYVAYFFDDIHMQPGDLLNARQAANHHLDRTLDSGMRAGVFTTSGQVTQGFTNDAEKLHAAVNRVQPWTSAIDKQECLRISFYLADLLINQEGSLGPGRINPGSPLAVELYNEASVCLNPLMPPPQPVVMSYLWGTASRSLEYGMAETISGLRVLRDLITKMSALPGSRTIVMVSPGFILSAEQRFNENGILDSAIHASVTINALDIKGVYTPLREHGLDPEFGGNFGGPSSAPGEGAAERAPADRDELSRSSDLLAELAYGTGGRVHNDNAFEEGLMQLAGRPEYVYVLGFSPDNLKFDGSYHGLKVKIKEEAKFDIEARRGYWAPRRAVDPAEAAREELKETLFSRDEIGDIPLDLHTDFFKPGGGKSELTVVARLDAKSLRFRKAADRNNDTLTVVTGLFDRNGNYISGIERVVEMRLRDKSLEVLEDSGISVEENFSVPAGNYVVRVVVKDGEGKTTAARNTGIEVP